MTASADLLGRYLRMVEAMLLPPASSLFTGGARSSTRYFNWRRYSQLPITQPMALAGLAAGLTGPAMHAPCVGNAHTACAIIGGHYGWAQAYLLFAVQADGYAIALFLGTSYDKLTDRHGQRFRGPKPYNPTIIFRYFIANDG